jgi:hypothetical protein
MRNRRSIIIKISFIVEALKAKILGVYYGVYGASEISSAKE